MNIERAARRAKQAGVSIRFKQSDVKQLPFANNELDAVLAECTFSLFRQQQQVLEEIRRVLKPGGKLAITDMATAGALPDDIAAVLAPWTCLADAVEQGAYEDMFVKAGKYRPLPMKVPASPLLSGRSNVNYWCLVPAPYLIATCKCRQVYRLSTSLASNSGWTGLNQRSKREAYVTSVSTWSCCKRH